MIVRFIYGLVLYTVIIYILLEKDSKKIQNQTKKHHCIQQI